MDYKQAGVDIDAGNLFAQMVKERVDAAWPGAGEEIGGFAGGGPIPEGAREVKASNDGTGTKILLAAMIEWFEGIGHDGVAMGAVDTYVSGSRPWYLLDNLSMEKLKPEVHIKIIESLIHGCLLAGCRLISGETEELPGTFKYPWMVNLSVTSIGFPAPELAFAQVEPGQLIYGWPSGCGGANGFSLLRRTFRLDERPSRARKRLERYWSEFGCTLAEELLRPTPIWIQNAEAERKRGVKFAGHAHITGGGMVENIPRILPSDCKVVINRSTWRRPPIFQVVQIIGMVSQSEMDRVFNNGIMMVSIVSDEGKPLADKNAVCIGSVERRRADEPQVQFVGEHNDGY